MPDTQNSSATDEAQVPDGPRAEEMPGLVSITTASGTVYLLCLDTSTVTRLPDVRADVDDTDPFAYISQALAVDHHRLHVLALSDVHVGAPIRLVVRRPDGSLGSLHTTPVVTVTAIPTAPTDVQDPPA